MVAGISTTNERNFTGECISDDIIKAIQMFREIHLSVHEIYQMEQVSEKEKCGVTKVDNIVMTDDILEKLKRKKVL